MPLNLLQTPGNVLGINQAVPPQYLDAFRTDADTGVIFARQLEMLETKIYEKRYALLKAREHFALNFSGGPANMGRTYRIFDRVGMAQWGLNFPRVRIRGNERTVFPKEYSASYGHTFLEILRANAAGMDIDSAEALAAAKVCKEFDNRVAYLGDRERDIPGAFTHPNFPIFRLSVPISTAATPRQIQAAISDVINQFPILTKGVEHANAFLMTIKQKTYLETTPTSDLVPDFMIMDTLKKAHPDVEFDWCSECVGAAADGGDIMFAYNRDEENMDLWIPHDLEVLPTQEGPNYQEFTTGMWELFGGLIVKYAVGAIIEVPA